MTPNKVRHSMENSFTWDLSSLINRHAKDLESDTPEYLLAELVESVLAAYRVAVRTQGLFRGAPWFRFSRDCLVAGKKCLSKRQAWRHSVGLDKDGNFPK